MLARFRILGFLALALLPLAGCLFRSHSVRKQVFVGTLKQATMADLVARVNADAGKIKTIQATVDIDSSTGGSKTGKVTEYQEIRGYVLLRRPGMLRMQGLLPVVRNKAFDMVSDGARFRLSIPPKNKFVIGAQEVKTPSDKPFENLRPRQIYDVLLIPEIPINELPVLESGTVLARDAHHKDIEEPNYILTLIHYDNESGRAWISRKIYFSREDLTVQKQVLFDKEGNAATIGTYNNYVTAADGTMFPHLITIERPQEQYTMQLGVVKVDLNVPLTDDQFQIPRPEGSELQVLDNVQPNEPPKGAAPKNQR